MLRVPRLRGLKMSPAPLRPPTDIMKSSSSRLLPDFLPPGLWERSCNPVMSNRPLAKFTRAAGPHRDRDRVELKACHGIRDALRSGRHRAHKSLWMWSLQQLPESSGYRLNWLGAPQSVNYFDIRNMVPCPGHSTFTVFRPADGNGSPCKRHRHSPLDSRLETEHSSFASPLNKTACDA